VGSLYNWSSFYCYVHLAIRCTIWNVLNLFFNGLLEKPTGWKSRPKFRSTILNKTAIVGDSVRLHCEVDGSPEPTITWRKDSQNVSQDKNIVIQRLRFKSVLTIRKVGKNDQGRYSCEAFNGFGPPLNVHGSLIVEYRSK
jgi:hypothetical protein